MTLTVINFTISLEIHHGPSLEVRANAAEGEIDEPFGKRSVRQPEEYWRFTPEVC